MFQTRGGEKVSDAALWSAPVATPLLGTGFFSTDELLALDGKIEKRNRREGIQWTEEDVIPSSRSPRRAPGFPEDPA
jgi:hypothetical protein